MAPYTRIIVVPFCNVRPSVPPNLSPQNVRPSMNASSSTEPVVGLVVGAAIVSENENGGETTVSEDGSQALRMLAPTWENIEDLNPMI